jgi:hypothetical protein
MLKGISLTLKVSGGLGKQTPNFMILMDLVQ